MAACGKAEELARSCFETKAILALSVQANHCFNRK